MFVGHLYVFLSSMFILPIFFYWVVCFLDIEPHELFVNFGDLVGHIVCEYFLLFCGLSFCFVCDFLGCAKALSLIRSHLFIFVFISITLGDG